MGRLSFLGPTSPEPPRQVLHPTTPPKSGTLKSTPSSMHRRSLRGTRPGLRTSLSWAETRRGRQDSTPLSPPSRPSRSQSPGRRVYPRSRTGDEDTETSTLVTTEDRVGEDRQFTSTVFKGNTQDSGRSLAHDRTWVRGLPGDLGPTWEDLPRSVPVHPSSRHRSDTVSSRLFPPRQTETGSPSIPTPTHRLQSSSLNGGPSRRRTLQPTRTPPKTRGASSKLQKFVFNPSGCYWCLCMG